MSVRVHLERDWTRGHVYVYVLERDAVSASDEKR